MPTSLGPQAGLWIPELVYDLDPNCFQEWIEPAHQGELGFEEARRHLVSALLPEERRSEPPGGQGRALVLSAPEVPCAYQTTFGYTEHLGLYLRRHGPEPGYVPDAGGDPEAALALLEGPWLRAIYSAQPWRCPAEEGDPLGAYCPYRAQYKEAGTFEAQDSELSFTLWMYQRSADSP